MIDLERLQEKVKVLLRQSDALEKYVTRLEDEAAALEPEQCSGLARITLLEHSVLQGMIATSRRRWKIAAQICGTLLIVTWAGVILSVIL